MLSSGSLKTMSQLYKISYPTLRRRLDQLINKNSHVQSGARRRLCYSDPHSYDGSED
ncbi:hypothetical protein QP849_00920 [Alloscardovia omnicolens]|nr:hypothetical protein [Alloscardovia omnicolens]MDK8648982.1 hypothetical protein [Alloscardovia omnicolens]